MTAWRKIASDPGCAEWRRAFDCLALQEDAAIDPHLERAIAEHARVCARCAAEAEAWRSFGRKLDRVQVRAEDSRAIVDEVMKQVCDAGAVSSLPPKRRAYALGATAAAVCAAAIVLLWINDGSVDRSERPREERSASLGSSTAEAELMLVAGEVAISDQRVALGVRPVEGDVLVVGEGRTCLQLDHGITLCLAAHTKLALTAIASKEKVVTLESGELVADLERQVAGRSFEVRTPHGSARALGTRFAVTAPRDASWTAVRVDHGRVRAIDTAGRQRELAPAGSWTMGSKPQGAIGSESDDLIALVDLLRSDLRGRLEVRHADDPSTGIDAPATVVFIDGRALGPVPVSAWLAAGSHVLDVRRAGLRAPVMTNSFDLGPNGKMIVRIESGAESPNEARGRRPARRERPVSESDDPASPLKEARRLRADGRFSEAAALYQDIHAAAPTSRTGLTALVLLGDLRLSGLHDPRGALRAFEAYLATGDRAYALEAGYGRVQALRMLGRLEEERAAIQALLAHHPEGPLTQGLRARLHQLSPE